MPVRARDDLAPWPTAMIVCGPGFSSAPHHHHCVQLILALHGSLLVRAGRKNVWKKCAAVWVQTDATHEVDARGTTLLLGFISAESDLGATLSQRIDGEIACVPAREIARWRAVLGLTPNDARAERWLTTCLPRRSHRATIHPGVQRVLTHLREPRAAFDDLSLKTLARVAGLSPSRFMHAFTQSVGVPVRPYILWLRLQRAACDLKSGTSVTSVAHRAGFADAAHLTRTFRRMLGITPSQLPLFKRVSLGFSTETNEREDCASQSRTVWSTELSYHAR